MLPCHAHASVYESASGILDACFGSQFSVAEVHEARQLLQLVLSRTAQGTDAGKRRSQLCGDGTPVEVSIAIDDLGRHAIRFVCDTVDCDRSREKTYRHLLETTELLVPSHWAARAALEILCRLHLANIPNHLRCRMYHGIACTPGGRPGIKLYFNTAWMRPSQIDNLLTNLIDCPSYRKIPVPESVPVAAVAYDLHENGITRIKLYYRLPPKSMAAIASAADAIAPEQAGELGRLCKFLASPDTIVRAALCAIGFTPLGPANGFTIHVPAASLGIGVFSKAAALWRCVLSSWGIAAPQLPESDLGVDPTLLSIGIGRRRAKAALYFRPA